METIDYLVKHFGLLPSDITKLQREGRRLHRFYERQCDDISFNEDTGKYERYCPMMGVVIGTVRDVETPCKARIAKIMESYPDLSVYHQTDPRGAPLYVYFKKDADGHDIESCYSSIGCHIPMG